MCGEMHINFVYIAVILQQKKSVGTNLTIHSANFDVFILSEQESHTPPNRRISVIPSQVNFSAPELVETTLNRSRRLSSRVVNPNKILV